MIDVTDTINAMIDNIPADATDEEIEAVMLKAFGVFAVNEIPRMGIPPDAEETLLAAFAPFAEGEAT